MSSTTEAPIDDAIVEEVIAEKYYTIVHAQTRSYFEDRARDIKENRRPISIVLMVKSPNNPIPRQIRLDATKVKFYKTHESYKNEDLVKIKATYLGRTFKGCVDFDTSPHPGFLKSKK